MQVISNLFFQIFFAKYGYDDKGREGEKRGRKMEEDAAESKNFERLETEKRY